MKGKLSKNKYSLKKSKFGYWQIHPIPSQDYLENFYKKKYYSKVKKGGGSREAKLLSRGSKVRDIEIAWLKKTYFLDRLDILEKFLPKPPKRVLDVGCGSGEFIEFMKDSGWQAVGIEPSLDVFHEAQSNGLKVHNVSLERLLPSGHEGEGSFGAVVLSNLLEHMRDPEETLYIVRKLLKPQGLLCVEVPNEFNLLQNYASKKVNKKKWWITIPDHINYFDFTSLKKLLKHCGFESLVSTTDFPMELFLLMGENYVDNPSIGKRCHKKRIEFETSVPKELRRNLYSKLSELGLGRQCIIYARKI